jgi:hypothetical protein
LPTPSLIDRLTERAGELAQLHHQAEDARIQAQWQLVAAAVRRVVPNATALRLEGDDTEQGLRLGLLQVLVDGESAKVDAARWRQLEDTLEQLLLLIAELEAPEVIAGEQDHNLPDLTYLPGDGELLTLPLLGEGEQLRIYAPNRAEGDLGHMLIVDALGVTVQVRQRNDEDVYVHVDDGQTSVPPPGATTLVVEVRSAGEQEHRL